MRCPLKILFVLLLGFHSGLSAYGADPQPPNQPPATREERVRAFGAAQAHAVRDARGVVRQLRHMQHPFTTKEANLAEGAVTPRSSADAYVRQVAPLMEVRPEWVADLAPLAQAPAPVQRGTEIQFAGQKALQGTTVVSYAETFAGLPAWEAGISVVVLDKPLRVTSSTNSIHPDVDARMPGPGAKLPPKRVTPEALAAALGLKKEDLLRAPLKLNRPPRMLVYQYDPPRRLDPEATARQGRQGEPGLQALQAGPPTLPLPPVPDAIQPGRHHVVDEALFNLPVPNIGPVNWRALIDVETGAVLYLRAFVSDVTTGLIFRTDPITQTGNIADTPTAPVAVLDPLRTSADLPGLTPSNPQALSGQYAQLVDMSPPTDTPPTEPPGTPFGFSVPSDGFAETNAYYHSDAVFRMMDTMGIPVTGPTGIFDETTFPVPVDGRALNDAINAQGLGNATGTGSGGFLFGTAGGAGTVGIAADWRVVLHEFSHALLWDAVHSPNFGFAHSAGDSMAAILNDPGSLAPDRFVSFPWVNIGRRHDRPVSGGWGWGGTNDVGGYSSEQILSTTMFRAYQAIGGDDASLPTKQLAAQYQVNLIIRGISLLGTSPITPSPTPDVYETALMNADMGTPLIAGIPGGAVHKVIRWAFEKQGLHRLPGTPPTQVGAPPPVDVYIDDGRGGEYAPYLPDFWETTDIWNRHNPDGGTAHETPYLSTPNYVYVRVKNRGQQTATDVTVRVYHDRPATGLLWPGDWQAATTPVRPAPGDPAITLAAGATQIVGPFEWTPTIAGHECLLASVSADDDQSNIDPASVLPCNTGPTPHWRLVPFDNNIAQRNVAPVPGGGGLEALIKALENCKFTFYNPHRVPGRARVEVVLPKLLAERGWMATTSAGEEGFRLGPFARREIELRVKPGRDFKPSEIKGRVAIVVRSYVNDNLVGGLTYALDPRLKAPPPNAPAAVRLLRSDQRKKGDMANVDTCQSLERFTFELRTGRTTGTSRRCPVGSVREMAMMLQETPTWRASSASVASGRSRTARRSRSRPSWSRAGGCPPLWGLGASESVWRRRSNRVMKDGLTSKQRAISACASSCSSTAATRVRRSSA